MAPSYQFSVGFAGSYRAPVLVTRDATNSNDDSISAALAVPAAMVIFVICAVVGYVLITIEVPPTFADPLTARLKSYRLGILPSSEAGGYRAGQQRQRQKPAPTS